MTITQYAQIDVICDTIAERDSITIFGRDGWRCFVKNDGTAVGRAYTLIGGVWTTYSPSGGGSTPHTHAEIDVTNLATDLSGKANTTHAHAAADVTGTAVITNDARLSDARTPLSHVHSYEPANANIQTHVLSAHAPSTAQKNSDILQAEIEAKLTGAVSTHTHAGGSGQPLGYVVLANDTLAQALATNINTQITVTAARTLTTTVPAAGARCSVVVVTSGTVSFVITFGTGFKPVGTLATGTVTARAFVVDFISNGTILRETGRTAAMAV